MKNVNYFPFERNKYFYGKLLSVDDFELEQRYMNDKRRMLNQFILGTGIVAGLYAVRIDEQTISIEKGIALDSWGREIVVDTPVIKKLSMIDGFDATKKEDSRYVYLCIEYDEKEIDQVHNIAGNISATREHGDLSYNKVQEGYHLFLTTQEPEDGMVSPADWYRHSQVIYQDGDIKITQCMPRYVRGGKKLPFKVIVENMGRNNISFSYDLVLNYLSSEEKAKLHVTFDEVLFERTGYYETEYLLNTSDAVGEEATAVIDPDSIRFRISGTEKNFKFQGKMSAQIVAVDEKEAMQQEYYRTSMEKLGHTGYQQPVYLAKIYMVRATDTYIIEKLENVPFDQYVSNHMLDSARYQMLQNEITVEKGTLDGKTAEGSGIQADGMKMLRMEQGVTEIYLQGGGQRGDKFFSDEIVHGLGLGKVTIVLGREQESDKIVFGSSGIFQEGRDKEINAELAACLNEENGSFVIGVRLLSNTVGGKIRVRWTAIQNMEQTVLEKNEKRIFIKPNLLELKVRQTHYLEAVCENMVEKAVLWKVKDDGGFIDENGMYTAPNTAGVYEVVAQSVAYPAVKASIFVVVRDAQEKS